VDPTRGGSDLLVSLLGCGDGAGDATVMIAGHRDAASRQARRRLRVHGVHCEQITIEDDGSWAVPKPAVHLAQYPSPGCPAISVEEILSAVENLVLQMDDSHRAVVIAPASALSDRIRDQRVTELRDALLRHGPVRAIVRLPQGLVIRKPRQALALWVLGPAYDTVHPQDRWTMVADLTDVDLDSAVIGDLVSDLACAMADRPAIRAHAFRFARPVWTRNLLAGGGDLVARRPRAVRSPRVPGSEIAVRIAELTAALSSGTTVGPPVRVAVEVRDPAEDDSAPPPLTLGEAIAAGQVRLIAGNRMDGADLCGGTVRVIGPEELTGTSPPGARSVDRLVFSARYPAGRYTEAGDVVFRTSPRPAALVDDEGGSVVLAPARILRISTPGLVPEVLASDINVMPAHARAWRGWPLRQVPPAEHTALADA
ncbi:MAG: hypothetical protein ACRD0H_25950, partial [Actinomycetes bacterium]